MRRLVIVLCCLVGAATAALADTSPLAQPPKLPSLPSLPPLNLNLPTLQVPIIQDVFALNTGVDFEIQMKTFGVQLCYDHEADRPTIGPEGFRCDDDFVRVLIDDVSVPLRSLVVDAVHNRIEVLNRTLTAGTHRFVVKIDCRPALDLVRSSAAVSIQYFPPVPTPQIQSVNVTSDGYEIVGQNFGSTATGALIAATAAVANQDFVSYAASGSDIVSYAPTKIVVRTDAVMGSVNHQVFVPDPHYPNRKSNVFTKNHPLHVTLAGIVPDATGYVITTNHYGTDLGNAVVMEGTTRVAASKLVRMSTTQLHVDDRISGTVTHQLLSNLPGVNPSRTLTVAHPTRPKVTEVRMTDYGLDLRGAHFGTDPSKVSVTFAATGRTVSTLATNAPFLRGVTDTAIAVNYAGGCERLFANPAASLLTDIDVLLLTGNQTGFFAPTLRTTIPSFTPQLTPAITAVNVTPAGLEILGSHLGDPGEVCQMQLVIVATSGAFLQVVGSSAASRFVSVTPTRWLVDVSALTNVTGDRDVTITRAGIPSAHFHIAGGT